MANITAAAVKALRDRTGLPMMDCKKALSDAGGDEDKAVDMLREKGAQTMEKRSGRETTAGRIAVYTDMEKGVGTIIELQCESAPVASHEEFVQLANDLAQQLATGPGASSPEELLAQTSPSKPDQTLQQQFDDLTNRIREVFKLQRIERIDGTCGGYAHHNGASGVLLQVEGGNAELGKDICMHIAAMRPAVATKEELDPADIEKERDILTKAALAEGKPENIVEKMVEGRLGNYYAERCLAEQPFVKDDKQTVSQVAKAAGMKIVRYVHWELEKE
jgi:elongation factor Ts